MIASASIFALALFLLSVFFVLKNMEASTGTEFPHTRLLVRLSPPFERWYGALVRFLAGRSHQLASTLRAAVGTVKAFSIALVRRVTVVVAARMVRAVKGERLVYQNGTNGAPSLFLKHLNEHKITEETRSE